MADPTPWTFGPGGDYTEELAWLTDVLAPPTGGSQHRRLRESPRTVIGFSVLESGTNRRWLDAQLRGHSAQRWLVPVAVDSRALGAGALSGATSLSVDVAGARFAAGGQALLIGQDPRVFEVVSIDSVGTSTLSLGDALASGWPAGTSVLPVRAGRLADVPRIGRFTADDSDVVPLRFELEEPLDTAPAIPGATYRGYPVFDAFAPVWIADPAWEPERRLQVVDYGLAAPLVVDLAGSALGKTTMQYAADGADSVAALRAALFAMAGRWAPVWVPSWAHDLRLAAPVGAGQGYIDVDGPLLSGQALADNHRDLRIEVAGGAVYYRRIEAATVLSASVDRLTLDAVLPSAVAVDEVRLLSFLTLSTQDSDTNALRYFRPDVALCELAWRELDHGI